MKHKSIQEKFQMSDGSITAEKNIVSELFNAWWRHQMETVFAQLAICAGNSPVPVNSPTKASDAELWCFLWSSSE